MIKKDVIIIGAGPVGLFAVHQLGIKGLNAVVIDNLDKAGGQCIELYPDKPIYDIPGIPECTGKELTNKLLEQIKPFKTEFFLNERVEEVQQKSDNWFIKTNNKKYMILGDMLELGKHSKNLHRKISPIINSTKIDKVYIFGNHIKETFKNIKPSKKGLILKESSQIIDLIKNKLNNNDYLMIKGSNSTGLNKFTNQLKKMQNAL